MNLSKHITLSIPNKQDLKKDHSTIDHIFTLKSLIDLTYLRKKECTAPLYTIAKHLIQYQDMNCG